MCLNPTKAKETSLQAICLDLSSTLIRTRWALETHTGNSVPIPFLILLIFWLTIVFASYGLFAPVNPTTMVVLVLCALAVSGGIVLIEELDNSLAGLIPL